MPPAVELPLVISIQSQVAWGHVGNSAAAFAMRAAGVEVVEVPTVLLSNHPRHPTVRGEALAPELVAALLQGIAERGLHARAAVILSGFMARAATAQPVAQFVGLAQVANPAVRYLCDPVMGDSDLGFFAPEDLRRTFAERLVPLADVILPNAFELGALAGIGIDGPARVEEARQVLGRPAVVATSVPVPGAPDRLSVVTAREGQLMVTEVTRQPVRPMGTGDLLGGLLAARLAQGASLEQAVARATAGVAVALAHTGPGHSSEMPLVARMPEILAAETPAPAAPAPGGAG